MHKKTYKKVLAGMLTGALLASSLLMGGCRGSETGTESVAVEDDQTAGTNPDGYELNPQGETEETEAETMQSRSLMVKGSNYRLKKVIEKIQNGEEVTVGFIGGSITYGYNAGTEDIFANLVTTYLDTTYGTGEGKVTCVNAGISGTPSMLGLIRADRDLLSAEPDLIFIEFAVNDAQTFTDKQAFESLIRKCLSQDNAPAVAILCSMTSEGYTCQDHMSQTAFYYNLPVVSVKNAIQPEIDAGNMTWADWSKDEAHPNANGHQLYASFIEYMIDQLAAADTDEEYVMPETTKFGKDWTDMELLTSDDILDADSDFAASSAHGNFPKSWTKSAESTQNRAFEFEVECSTLFLVYKNVDSATYGTAEVSVDGEVVAHLEANTEDGWYNPVTELIFTEDESAVHTVSIRMQDGDEDKIFDLLGIGVCP